MEIKITAVELYYLGDLLQAKYIDYAYIAAMDDIQDNFALHKKETLANLVKKGLLDEDFSGELTVNKDVVALLKPIFFGEMESSIDVCWLTDPKKVDVYKFHFLDDNITMVTGVDEELLIKEIDILYLMDITSSLLPQNYGSIDNEGLAGFNYDSIKRLIAIKNTKNNVVRVYFDSENVLFLEKEKEVITPVTENEFTSEVISILKGNSYGL